MLHGPLHGPQTSTTLSWASSIVANLGFDVTGIAPIVAIAGAVAQRIIAMRAQADITKREARTALYAKQLLSAHELEVAEQWAGFVRSVAPIAAGAAGVLALGIIFGRRGRRKQ